MVEHWQPDVLLSDIAMPDHDGYWLITQVPALEERQFEQAPTEPRKRVPAIALTAYVKIENRVQVLQAGFDMFVPKPVNPVELLTVISSLMTSAKSAA